MLLKEKVCELSTNNALNDAIEFWSLSFFQTILLNDAIHMC